MMRDSYVVLCVTCDRCGDADEYAASSLREGRSDARDNGWVLGKSDRCPKCSGRRPTPPEGGK